MVAGRADIRVKQAESKAGRVMWFIVGSTGPTNLQATWDAVREDRGKTTETARPDIKEDEAECGCCKSGLRGTRPLLG